MIDDVCDVVHGGSLLEHLLYIMYRVAVYLPSLTVANSCIMLHDEDVTWCCCCCGIRRLVTPEIGPRLSVGILECSGNPKCSKRKRGPLSVHIIGMMVLWDVKSEERASVWVWNPLKGIPVYKVGGVRSAFSQFNRCRVFSLEGNIHAERRLIITVRSV